MRKFICIVFVGIMLFSGFTSITFADGLNATDDSVVVTARAGGGGSSGGGGGSSGGGGNNHSNGSYHTGYGQRPTLLSSIIQFIMMPFLMFFSSVLFYIKLTKRARKSKKLMKKMMQSDSAWKYRDIKNTVEVAFCEIQKAWADMDMTPASKYMSDKLCDSFQTKLNWMAYRNEKNVLENIELLQALPVAIYDDADNTRDYIWFYIKGRMTDYIINTNTHLKISGNTSPATFVEYWRFVRKENRWVLDMILQKDESGQIPFTE